MNIPGTDEWYIINHPHPLGDRNGKYRKVCVDRVEFEENGYIKPVKLAFEEGSRRKI